MVTGVVIAAATFAMAAAGVINGGANVVAAENEQQKVKQLLEENTKLQNELSIAVVKIKNEMDKSNTLEETLSKSKNGNLAHFTKEQLKLKKTIESLSVLLKSDKSKYKKIIAEKETRLKRFEKESGILKKENQTIQGATRSLESTLAKILLEKQSKTKLVQELEGQLKKYSKSNDSYSVLTQKQLDGLKEEISVFEKALVV